MSARQPSEVTRNLLRDSADRFNLSVTGESLLDKNGRRAATALYREAKHFLLEPAESAYREMKHFLPGNEPPAYRETKHFLPGNETRNGRIIPGNETLFGSVTWRNSTENSASYSE